MKREKKQWIRLAIMICCMGFLFFGGVRAEAAETLAAPNFTVSNTAKGVQLSWTAVPGASGYTIYYKYASGLSRIGGVRGKTTYIDTKVTPGRTYTYVVRAYAGKVSSSYQTKSILYLRAVTLNVKNTSQGVTLTWDKAAGAKNYVIYRKVKGGSYARLAAVSNTTFAYTDKKASSGVTYAYAVKAFRDSTKSAHIPKEIRYLAAPSVSLTRMTDGVKISWKQISGANRYYIYRKQGSQSYTRVKDIGSGQTVSWKDTTASKNQAYTYAVVAANGSARSAYVPKTISADLTITWNSSWTYAGNSKIHSSSVKLYRSPNSNGIVVAVNAGHGTAGGESVMTLCHPDGSGKVTGGSTAAGSYYATAVSSGTVLLDGTSEAAANLSLSLILKEKLLAAGYDVLMIRESADVQLDNIARTVIANQYADCHVAIHYDSTTNDKGFFFIGVPEVASYRNMTPVAQTWKKHMKLGNAILSGVKQNGLKVYSTGNVPLDLTQTSYSTIPSVDVEVGDRGSDHSKAAQTKLAEGIKDGIDSYFGR